MQPSAASGDVVEKLRKTMVFWGAMDLVGFGYYVLASVAGGRLPFISDFQQASLLASQMDDWQPVIIAGVGIGLYLSLPVVGLLLLKGRRAGGWFSLALSPLRPMTTYSVFFLPLGIVALGGSAELGLAAGITLEAIKAATVVWWLRRTRPT